MSKSSVPRVSYTAYSPYYLANASQYRLPLSKARQPNMTFEQRLKILDFYHAHKHELTLDQMIQPLQEQGFPNICRATIQRCLKREAKDRAFVASGNPSCLNASRKAPYCPPEVEAQLVAWIKSKQAQGIQLPGAFICEKARMLCTDYGMPQEMQLKFSKSWLETFKGRYGLDLPKGIPWYAYGYVADLAPRQPGAGSTTEPRSSAIESRAK